MLRVGQASGLSIRAQLGHASKPMSTAPQIGFVLASQRPLSVAVPLRLSQRLCVSAGNPNPPIPNVHVTPNWLRFYTPVPSPFRSLRALLHCRCRSSALISASLRLCGESESSDPKCPPHLKLASFLHPSALPLPPSSLALPFPFLCAYLRDLCVSALNPSPRSPSAPRPHLLN